VVHLKSYLLPGQTLPCPNPVIFSILKPRVRIYPNSPAHVRGVDHCASPGRLTVYLSSCKSPDARGDATAKMRQPRHIMDNRRDPHQPPDLLQQPQPVAMRLARDQAAALATCNGEGREVTSGYGLAPMPLPHVQHRRRVTKGAIPPVPPILKPCKFAVKPVCGRGGQPRTVKLPGTCKREAGLDGALVGKDSMGTYRKDGQDRTPPRPEAATSQLPC
jgi:hypothetical protein